MNVLDTTTDAAEIEELQGKLRAAEGIKATLERADEEF